MPRTLIHGDLVDDNTITADDIGATGDATASGHVLVSVGGPSEDVEWLNFSDMVSDLVGNVIPVGAPDPHTLDGTSHTGITGTEDNFMSLTAVGLPQDSGYNASDFSGGSSAPLELIDVYDNAGGQTNTGTTTTLNLDTERQNIGNSFTLSGDVVTADTTGYFTFTVRVSTGLSTGSDRTETLAWLEVDTGSGFVEVDGFRGWMYNRTAAESEETCTMVGVLYVESGYQYRVRFNRISGTSTVVTLADGSGLLIQGTQGPRGSDGSTGPQGPQGPQGQAGIDGTNGIDGINGIDGTNGIDGIDGTNGIDGKAAPHLLDGTTHIGISGTPGNFMAINSDGLPVDSGYDAADFGTSDSTSDVFPISVSRSRNATDIYLRQGDGTPTNMTPFILPWDCTLESISAASNGSETWTAEIHSGLSLVSGATLSITAASSAYSTAYGITFSAGDPIEIYCNGTSVNRPRVTAIFRRT